MTLKGKLLAAATIAGLAGCAHAPGFQSTSVNGEVQDQQAFPVYPEDDHNFFYTVVPAQITFITGADGRATGLVLQGGQDVPASRIE